MVAPVGSLLEGISCASFGNCTAVGSDGAHPIVETEDSGVWGPTAEVSLPSVTILGSISCTSPGNCSAAASPPSSLVATETNGAWSGPAALAMEGIFSISCTSPGTCTVAGIGPPNGHGTFVGPYVATETGGVWGAPTELTAPDDSLFNGVSCTSPGNCIAVGSVSANQFGLEPRAMMATETDGTWSAVALVATPIPNGGYGGQLNGVSCTGPGNCTAVGSFGLVVTQTSAVVSVGTVTQVVGSVTITHADGSVTTAVPGSPIAQGDAIQTSANGAVNIRFADDTTFAISENARMSVDQFVYNASDHQGSTLFSLLQGAFVWTSGLIGKTNPGAVNIETPVGEIGIRGTQFILQVSPDQDQIDLIQGEVAPTPTLTGVTTTVDAPETATFNSSGITGTAPLTEAAYELLEAQLFPVTPPFEVAPVILLPATPSTSYGPMTLEAANLGASTSPYVTTLKWKKVTLPKGLTLSSAGVLSGTPSSKLVGGPSSITVQATETVTTLNDRRKVKTTTTVEATIPITIIQPQPAVTSVHKTSGPSAGGTTVSIKGTALQGASVVTFGTVDATSFTVNSAGTTITAITPEEAAGPVDVRVTDPGGTSPTSSADVFTFTP